MVGRVCGYLASVATFRNARRVRGDNLSISRCMLWPMSKQIREKVSSIAEAGARIESKPGKGPRYEIRAMGWEPGAEFAEGSSGRYPVAAIKRDFNSAYPVGTRMKANHDGFCEQGGDIRRLMAKTDGDWDFREDGAYVPVQFSKEWADFVEEFGDVIGVSIAAGVEIAEPEEHDGDYDEAGRPIDEDGNPIDTRAVVERFLTQEESPYNSIDFVEAPGADGRIIKALESAKGHFEHVGMREAAIFASHYIEQRQREKTSEAAPPRNTEKENAMDEQMLQAIEAAATRAAERAVESFTPAPAEPVTIRMEDVAEATFEAGLSKGSREAVYARVNGGEALEAAVAAEQAREAEIEEAVKARLATEQGHGGYPVGQEAAAGSAAEYLSLVEASVERSVS